MKHRTVESTRLRLVQTHAHGHHRVRRRWEFGAAALVGEKRKAEMGWIARMKLVGLGAGVVWTLTPVLLPLLTFTFYVAGGGRLTAATAFQALALFDVRGPRGAHVAGPSQRELLRWTAQMPLRISKSCQHSRTAETHSQNTGNL